MVRNNRWEIGERVRVAGVEEVGWVCSLDPREVEDAFGWKEPMVKVAFERLKTNLYPARDVTRIEE